MSTFFGVILPIVLIVIANKLQNSYNMKKDEERYRNYVTRFTGDVLKQLKELAPKE